MSAENHAYEKLDFDAIRRMMRPKRTIIFCAEADEPTVAEACQQLRDEGHQITHKPHRWLDEGTAYGVDADALQPRRIPITEWFGDDNRP